MFLLNQGQAFWIKKSFSLWRTQARSSHSSKWESGLGRVDGHYVFWVYFIPVWPLCTIASNSPAVNDWSFLKIGRLSWMYPQYSTSYTSTSFWNEENATPTPSPTKDAIRSEFSLHKSLAHFKIYQLLHPVTTTRFSKFHSCTSM